MAAEVPRICGEIPLLNPSRLERRTLRRGCRSCVVRDGEAVSTRMGLAFRDLHRAETDLAREFRRVAHRHAAEADVFHLRLRFAEQCDRHAATLVGAGGRYGEQLHSEPVRPPVAGPARARRAVRPVEEGPVLLAHLRALSTLAHECEISWTVIGQGAKAHRDDELAARVDACGTETAVQGQWLRTRLEEAAPQVLSG
jgi:hypothetical protein